jgi:hypothetical protein
MQSMAVPSLNKELISKIKSQLKSALETSKLQFQTMRDTEVRLVDNNIVVRPGSSSALFSLVSHTTPETQKINFGALQETFIADDIVKRFEKLNHFDDNSFFSPRSSSTYFKI